MSLFINAFIQTLFYIFPFGLQNLYVLRQGLIGRYPFTVALCAVLSDIFLITLGALGFSVCFDYFCGLGEWITLCGACFLFFYGTRSLLKGILGTSKATKLAHVSAPSTLFQVIAYTLGFSLLNPQVILETVVFLGNQAALMPLWPTRVIFLAGSFSAVCVWFFGLSFGSKALHVLFQNPVFARFFDTAVGIVLYYIAYQLFSGQIPSFI
jgi:L-lysine exporter family protein LysE/ArgO